MLAHVNRMAYMMLTSSIIFTVAVRFLGVEGRALITVQPHVMRPWCTVKAEHAAELAEKALLLNGHLVLRAAWWHLGALHRRHLRHEALPEAHALSVGHQTLLPGIFSC